MANLETLLEELAVCRHCPDHSDSSPRGSNSQQSVAETNANSPLPSAHQVSESKQCQFQVVSGCRTAGFDDRSQSNHWAPTATMRTPAGTEPKTPQRQNNLQFANRQRWLRVIWWLHYLFSKHSWIAERSLDACCRVQSGWDVGLFCGPLPPG